MSAEFGFHLAESEEERRAVYRFRYAVYVEEMGRYQGLADHANRWLVEPEDAVSRIFYATQGDEVVGTARLTWGGDGPLPPRQIQQYGLAPFLAEVSEKEIAVGERGMVAPRLRGSDLLLKLLGESFRFVNDRRILLIFGDCEPHLLNLYLGLGHRTYSRTNVNSTEAGYLIPILTVVEDVAYLRQVGSPLVEYARDFGDDARIPACVGRIIAEGSAITSRRLTSSGAYWGAVHDAFSELEENRPSALDGLDEVEAARCLAKSTIIECGEGDRLLKKGGVARNLFVLLDGALEVRDGDAVVSRLGPGDVFGEIAFLLERPRTMDVYAASDGVRVLSLSETTIRQMIESDAEIAAKLLLNISKMLCLRLIRNA